VTLRADVGVIGGSGFYSFLGDATEVEIDMPCGSPSAPPSVGEVGGCAVAFLPRHGNSHEHPPHRVNFRANVWAMRELGVTRLVAPCAVGSLRPNVHPGDVVVCDQLVDRTWGRPDTFFDGPTVNHVSFADPYCPELRSVALVALRTHDIPHHAEGTVVVIQGPRFSTRAESRWFRSVGWSVVNMTQYPEAVLARELGICYAALGLVTDYDSGLERAPDVRPVEMADVFAQLNRNVDTTRALLTALIPSIPIQRGCPCQSAATTGA
jgi:5'-methylthioadenosine phosphorylase